MNSSGVLATRTTEPKLLTTSGTAVLTIIRPVAIYSSALVGLINSVDSFSAKGMRQTSNPLQNAGRSLYARCPSQWRFGTRGREAGSTFMTGPIIATDQSGLALAS